MPWIEQRSSGWRIRYRVPGQTTIPSIDGFPTKAAAQAHLTTMTVNALHAAHHPADADDGPAAHVPEPPAATATVLLPPKDGSEPSPIPTPPLLELAPQPGLKLRAWVDRWWDALDVADNTQAQYRSLLKNHILPTWGDHELTALSRIELQAWLKQLRRRYAHTSVATIRKLLARICADAVDEGLLPVNPVQRPRGGRMIRPATRKVITATPDQILAFQDRLTCADFTLVVTAAYTGMRWGELAGLRPHRCHLDQGYLDIDPDDGSLHEVDGRLFLGPPKNGKGRTIHLPPFLTDLLRIHLQQIDTAQVFTSPDGTYLRRSSFNRRVWRPACDGDPTHPDPQQREPLLPGMRFHDLRHTHKTWMIEDDIPEVAQCDRLGHSLHGIRGVYSHTTIAMITVLLNKLQRRWTTAIGADPDDSTPLAA